MTRFGKVAVMFGGTSAEREISLMSGQAVLTALQGQGVDAHAFDPAHKPLSALHDEGFDRVFIALHGRGGEDGTVQGALELMKIPYTGSGVMASSVGMDKWRTKLMWQAVGIPTPEYAVLTADTDFAAVEATLGLPLMVKPAHEGSSIGIIKVTQQGELAAAFHEASQCDRLVIAERFIVGREYTAPVLDDEALPLIRIEAPQGNYDYEHKYFTDDTQYFCPAGLSDEVEAALRATVLRAFRVLGAEGWGRIDLMVDETGQCYLLEINTSPGMTSHSLVPMSARQAGISFEALCLRLLEGAHVG